MNFQNFYNHYLIYASHELPLYLTAIAFLIIKISLLLFVSSFLLSPVLTIYTIFEKKNTNNIDQNINADEMPTPIKHCLPTFKKRRWRKKSFCFFYQRKPDPWWKRILKWFKGLFYDDVYHHIRIFNTAKKFLNKNIDIFSNFLDLRFPWIKVIYIKYLLPTTALLINTLIFILLYNYLFWVILGYQLIDVICIQNYKGLSILINEFHFIKSLLLHSNLFYYDFFFKVSVVYIFACLLRLTLSWLIVNPTKSDMRDELFIATLLIWFFFVAYFTAMTYNEFFLVPWLWFSDFTEELSTINFCFAVSCWLLQLLFHPDFFFSEWYQKTRKLLTPLNNFFSKYYKIFIERSK
jgi:hypothetical protein